MSGVVGAVWRQDGFRRGVEGVGRVKKTSPRAWVGVGDVGRGGARVETGRGSGRETDAVRGRETTSP